MTVVLRLLTKKTYEEQGIKTMKGLTIHLPKCTLAREEVQYLGHVLGRGVIRPQTDQVLAVLDCPRSRTKKDIRLFLGLVGWYCWFVPDMARRAAPLSDLIRNSGLTQVYWGAEQEQAFLELNEVLCKDPVHQTPILNCPLLSRLMPRVLV